MHIINIFHKYISHNGIHGSIHLCMMTAEERVPSHSAPLFAYKAGGPATRRPPLQYVGVG